MSAAFTEPEKEQIRQALLQAASRHARQEGMKRVSVDTLAGECGISKGAFYHFYDTKELLFLDMLKEHYRRIVELAARECQECAGLPPVERASRMFRVALTAMGDAEMMRFIQNEVPLLLRRVPEQIQREHFQSIEDFVRSLLNMVDCRLKISQDVAVDIIRILFMSLLHAEAIGPRFPEALAAMVNSVCAQLIENGCRSVIEPANL